MKLRYALLLVAAFLCIATGCRNLSPKPIVYECATIHKPAEGCPSRWSEFPNHFTEKDGSKISACIAPSDLHLKLCTDALRAGESVEFIIGLDVNSFPETHYIYFDPKQVAAEPHPQPVPAPAAPVKPKRRSKANFPDWETAKKNADVVCAYGRCVGTDPIGDLAVNFNDLPNCDTIILGNAFFSKEAADVALQSMIAACKKAKGLPHHDPVALHCGIDITCGGAAEPIFQVQGRSIFSNGSCFRVINNLGDAVLVSEIPCPTAQPDIQTVQPLYRSPMGVEPDPLHLNGVPW